MAYLMKILAIAGSPRRGGNTEILLDKAIDGAQDSGAEVEKVVLNALNFRPCQECGGCDKTGVCVIKDDMQTIYRKVEEAEAVIVASPIFFGSLSAQVKMMIDRFQCCWVGKYVLKKAVGKRKRGALIACGATDRADFFANARSIIKNFFATVNVAYERELFCFEVDEKGKVLEHQDLLDKAYQLGKDLVEGI